MIKFKYKLGDIVNAGTNGHKGIVVKRTVSQSVDGYEYTYRVYLDGADVAQDYPEEDMCTAFIKSED